MSPRYLLTVIALCVAAMLVAGCTTPSPGPVTPAPRETIATPTIHETTAEKTPAAPVATTTTIPPTAAKPLKPAPTTLPVIKVPEGSIAQYYTYTLNGNSDIIGVALPTSVYTNYQNKPGPSAKNGNASYFLAYINDPEQQPYVTALAEAIKTKTPNPDDQARIAVNLVQHIPYREGKQYRYPYEVLYSGEGVCGEKSMLLALLLRDLGVGSAVFYFIPEDHMTAGISALAPYDFKNTGYAFIEATEPNIITYDGSEFDFGTVSSKPEVILVGTGRQLSSVSADYQDAHTYATILANINHLTSAQSQEYALLDTKYDLSYYTCQKCKIPAIA